MIICLFPAVAGRLTVARRLSPWSSVAISVLLQHHWDKPAPMFAATGETEASSPAGDGKNAGAGRRHTCSEHSTSSRGSSFALCTPRLGMISLET